MTFSKVPAPISPVPTNYQGAAGISAGESPLSSPAGAATTTTSCTSSPGGSGSSYYNYNNNSPQSPYYSVASSATSSSINSSPAYHQQQYYYDVDSPYSVQSATTTSTNGGHQTDTSSSAYSAYAGDNETVGSSGKVTATPKAKRAKQDDDIRNLDLKLDGDDDADAAADREYELHHHTPANAHALALLEQAVSEDGGLARSKVLDKKKDIKRERSSNLKALNLFDATNTGARQRTLSNDGRKEIDNLKQEKDVVRQSFSKSRALHLLNHTVTERRRREDTCRFVSRDGGAGIVAGGDNNTAASTEGQKARALILFDREVKAGQQHEALQAPSDEAKARALLLLDQATSGEDKNYRRYNPMDSQLKTASPGGGGGGLTTRQAASMEYEKRKREKMEVKTQVRQHKEKFANPPPKIRIPIRQELLAESTRRNHGRRRALTAEDVRDPETVAGMKCQLHWDRERLAQARALRLLNKGFKSIS